jgi:hypothetical protein
MRASPLTLCPLLALAALRCAAPHELGPQEPLYTVQASDLAPQALPPGTRHDARQDPQALRVQGRVTQSASYCGGAAPPQELLAELHRPKPVTGELFAVRAGDQNLPDAPVVARFVPDADGSFELWLPPGVYCLKEDSALDAELLRSPYQDPNIEACVVRVARSCLASWVVAPSSVGAGVEAHRVVGCGGEPCFPRPPVP